MNRRYWVSVTLCNLIVPELVPVIMPRTVHPKPCGKVHPTRVIMHSNGEWDVARAFLYHLDEDGTEWFAIQWEGYAIFFLKITIK